MNILKKYPEHLELAYLSEENRFRDLESIFERDIKNHPDLSFRNVKIYPIKDEESAMQTLFNHLTKEEIDEKDDNGKMLKRRVFDMHRSVRLHWIRYHIEEIKKNEMEVFSTQERVKGKTVFRTYIFDVTEKYTIVLEPQRSRGYYLLTAFYLHKDHGIKQMRKKIDNKLDVVL